MIVKFLPPNGSRTLKTYLPLPWNTICWNILFAVSTSLKCVFLKSTCHRLRGYANQIRLVFTLAGCRNAEDKILRVPRSFETTLTQIRDLEVFRIVRRASFANEIIIKDLLVYVNKYVSQILLFLPTHRKYGCRDTEILYFTGILLLAFFDGCDILHNIADSHFICHE